MDRFKPPRCEACGREPWLCPTCGDYQCACPAPWTLLLPKKKQRYMPRAHYDRDGRPYRAQFIDGYNHDTYPSEAADLKWLIEGG